MNFLHSDFNVTAGDEILVTLDAQANVMLLDDVSFSAYRHGRTYKYYGGWATRSPVRLSPPHGGYWHVVIDLGGRSGRVRAGIRLLEMTRSRPV